MRSNVMTSSAERLAIFGLLSASEIGMEKLTTALAVHRPPKALN